ncbi:DUF3147 family protein [Actinomadura scrupuli]|uniref:DUF3147 family protein n=1 Tax=Actinomadura scrupuli TaxID=559629 RepID=UPI003D98BD6A
MTGRPERVRMQPSRLRQVRPRDMAVRFGFGAAVSTIAGVISATAGPRAGGVFLAFPAILLASLTLVAKEEGLRTARDDARGAALGALGFIAFAVVCAVFADVLNGWLVLVLATLAWALVSFSAYLAVRLRPAITRRRG